MNQANYDYLKEQVKRAGFGEGHENELKEKMESKVPEFQIKHDQEFGKDVAAATLNFRGSQTNDNYYFNNYEMSVTHGKSVTPVEQKFYIGEENNYSFPEAYNLMSGRAVNKDLTNRVGQERNSWVKMDFKDADTNGNYKMKYFSESYGFDLDKTLANHPIKELGNEQDKANLINSLKAGNSHPVTFIRDGIEQKGMIEANPQFRTINVYDENMKRLSQGKKVPEGQSETEGKKQDQKKDLVNGAAKETPNNRKKRGQHV